MIDLRPDHYITKKQGIALSKKVDDLAKLQTTYKIDISSAEKDDIWEELQELFNFQTLPFLEKSKLAEALLHLEKKITGHLFTYIDYLNRNNKSRKNKISRALNKMKELGKEEEINAFMNEKFGHQHIDFLDDSGLEEVCKQVDKMHKKSNRILKKFVNRVTRNKK